MSGQKDNREERMRETADWLNATPVSCENKPLLADPNWVDPDLVYEEAEAIRTALAAGAHSVECLISRPDVVKAIREQLSCAELRLVDFPMLGLQTQ
jgi:hypothetical protein